MGIAAAEKNAPREIRAGRQRAFAGNGFWVTPPSSYFVPDRSDERHHGVFKSHAVDNTRYCRSI